MVVRPVDTELGPEPTLNCNSLRPERCGDDAGDAGAAALLSVDFLAAASVVVAADLPGRFGFRTRSMPWITI